EAFKEFRVREHHFYPSSGYGYGDAGRDNLENIYARVFAGEDALVRTQIVSGTHAISASLFGILRPGDKLISITGRPYDTLGRIIGKDSDTHGSLIEKGINYQEIAMDKQGYPDIPAISDVIDDKTRMVLIQRSRGYSLRQAVSIETMSNMIKTVKAKNPDTIIFVDNCYGEFTDILEPGHCGVDLIAGSLIKNPGGGLAPSGGYIAGNKDLVQEVAYHVTAPGLGKELGSSPFDKRYLYQGLFLAPHVVLQALKGAILLAYIFEQYGYEVWPRWNEPRSDIVQAVKLNNTDEVLQFCQEIQSNSPVDSDVTLEYAELPGYSHKIVMAAGTFVQGSSIELSCDAPLRSPHAVYLQGGLTYEHCQYLVARLMDRFIT
ncbi:MAG: methionine gamma-lyase family protein, partial [Syntrophomonadaceae bacterium]|nr:methionine gamma-lyase family protein [Syntrophomonadaceae bacterium]